MRRGISCWLVPPYPNADIVGGLVLPRRFRLLPEFLFSPSLGPQACAREQPPEGRLLASRSAHWGSFPPGEAFGGHPVWSVLI